MTGLQALWEVLEDDAESAATPERVAAVGADLLAAAPGRRTRVSGSRRFRIGLAGVAAVAVAAVVVTLFVGLRPDPRPVTSSPPAPEVSALLTSWQFDVAPDPGGIPFLYLQAQPGVQMGQWYDDAGTNDDPTALLQVTTPVDGRPVPVRPAAATDVTIGGTTGWSVSVDGQDPDFPHLFDGLAGYFDTGTFTVWTDATTGLTVSIAAKKMSAARVEQLASTVRLTPHPVLIPFRATWLPAGAELQSVALEPDGQASLRWSLGSSPFSLEVWPAGKYPSGVETDQPRTAPTHLGGFSVDYRPTSSLAFLTDGRTDVSIAWGPGSRKVAGGPATAMPLDQLTELVAGLTVDDPADSSTWTDIGQTVRR